MKYTVFVLNTYNDYPLFKVGSYDSLNKAMAVAAECEECREHYRTKIIKEMK